MKRTLGILMTATCLATSIFFLRSDTSLAQTQEQPLTAKEILDKVDDLFRGRSSRGLATMTVTTAHWKRSLKMEMWSKGKDKSFIRILAPKKEKGTTTLRSGNDIWN